RAQEAGKERGSLSSITARLRFADGRVYDHPGTLNFVDVTVNRATDTVLVRATFPNPGYHLIDGQLVNVTLELGDTQERGVVPQGGARAAARGGVWVWVGGAGRGGRGGVRPGGETAPGAALGPGLSGGEMVIGGGLRGGRRGARVRPPPTQPPLNQG